MTKKKPLEIDMVAGSQLRDSQGEMLSVEGADITDLMIGNGRLNDNHGTGFTNSIGRVTGAKKIFSEADCENDRHRYYWEKIKSPYIYVKGYLYDDEDHPNARSAAAILRNIHKTDAPLKIKASVEGGVMARGIKDSSLLARTKIHSVALTFTPANQNTLVEPLNLEKSTDISESDRILIEKAQELAKTNVPSFRHVTRRATAEAIKVKIDRALELAKSLGIEVDADLDTDALVKSVLKNKIEEKIRKINQLVFNMSNETFEKGSLQSKMGKPSYMLTDSSEDFYWPNNHGPTVKRMQNRTLNDKLAQNNHEVKMIDGKAHILLHRGIDTKSNAQQDNLRSPMTVNNKSVSHDKHGMYTDDYDYAIGFSGGNKNNVSSVWVPVSSLNRNMHHETNSAIKEAINNKNSDFAEYDEDRLREYADEPLYRPNHMLVNPGTYKKASQQEVEKHLKAKAAKSEDITKALTAGYGGAAAPTGRTGGAVFQTETLDLGRGFDYITCNKCGEEQVHATNQVKCRECGKPFEFEKLVNLIVKG